LKKDDFSPKIKPTEPELKEYFEANRENYAISEERRAKYLVISTSQLASTIEVTDDEVRARWDSSPEPETVNASHILFSVDDPSKDSEVRAEAEEILQRARAGEDFAELATQYSDDTASAQMGGSLGSFPRGRMVREFENVAFSLEPGQISDLVQTEYGYHIIKVIQHDIPTLESRRPSIIRDIQVERATELARQKAEQVTELSKEQKSLEAIAEALNVLPDIKDTGFLNRESDPWSIGISPTILNEIFSLSEINDIGLGIEHPTGYVVPQLVEVKLPKPPDFDESRETITQDYIDSRAEELLKAEGDRLAESARQSGDLEKSATGAGWEPKTPPPFKQDGSADPEIVLTTEFNSMAFHLPIGGVSRPVPVGDDARVAILQVISRTPFDESEFDKQKGELRQGLLDRWRDLYFQQYIQQITEKLEKAGKIRINSAIIEQVTGIGS
jgi:peptidyl-prolyl cis-trans isomerase D